MRTKLLVPSLLSISALLVGCVAPPQRGASGYPIATQQTPRAVVHSYRVKAVDADGQPLAGVETVLKLEAKGTNTRIINCVTDAQGECPEVHYEVSRDPSLNYVNSYISTATVEGKAAGYYTAKASGLLTRGISSYESGKKSDETMTLRMRRPIDYLADSFRNSPTDRELRERVLRFLDVIRLQGILVDAEVILRGIGVSQFKNQKYLSVKVNSTNVFNSLKLNKYDIGKRLFDEVVRKMLNPLNDEIAAPRAFYGYDIVAYGYTRSFADKYSSPTKLEFRFLMPESAVRRYKDKDISGQALLDASVILLDDERIDLKLQ